MASSECQKLTFSQLFTFQVLYAENGKIREWKRALLDVDFIAGMVLLQDKDRTIMSQPFSSYQKSADSEAEELLIFLCFETEQWQVIVQNIAEKTCIEHLLQCVLRRLTAEETVAAANGTVLLDKRIMKCGHILRKAKTRNKNDERFLVIVPGKLLLFKGMDIKCRHPRYVSSLLGATVRTLQNELEFHILSPNSKAIVFIASDAENLASWVELIEKSIEYADSAKSVVPVKDAVTQVSESPRSRDDQTQRLQRVSVDRTKEEKRRDQASEIPYESYKGEVKTYGGRSSCFVLEGEGEYYTRRKDGRARSRKSDDKIFEDSRFYEDRPKGPYPYITGRRKDQDIRVYDPPPYDEDCAVSNTRRRYHREGGRRLLSREEDGWSSAPVNYRGYQKASQNQILCRPSTTSYAPEEESDRDFSTDGRYTYFPKEEGHRLRKVTKSRSPVKSRHRTVRDDGDDDDAFFDHRRSGYVPGSRGHRYVTGSEALSHRLNAMNMDGEPVRMQYARRSKVPVVEIIEPSASEIARRASERFYR